MLSIEDQNVLLLDQFLHWFSTVRNRQPSSVYDYRSRLLRFVVFLGNTPLRVVQTEQMELWVTRIRHGRAAGTIGQPASRAKDVHVLRSMFKYLHGRGLVPRNPADLLFAPTVHNRIPKPVAEETWMQLWAADLSPDARVVLGLGFFVGLRRAEIVSLSPAHFSTARQRIVGFVRKGGSDDAVSYGDMVGVFADVHPHLLPDAGAFLDPLHQLAAERVGRPRLLDWRERRDPGRSATAKHSLGSNDVNPQWVNTNLRLWLKSAGLPKNAFTPHQMRHSAATYLIQGGVPLPLVSRLLNHSSLDVTMGYTKLGGDDLAEWRRRRG